jgi:Transposase, Mutator family
MERIPASERTREKLKALMEGRAEATDERSELVRLAARLIIEEALEGEAADALGRDYYARGAAPGTGYRNGYRTGRLKTAEGAVEFSAPQIADRAEPFRSRRGVRLCLSRCWICLPHHRAGTKRTAQGRSSRDGGWTVRHWRTRANAVGYGCMRAFEART